MRSEIIPRFTHKLKNLISTSHTFFGVVNNIRTQIEDMSE